MIQTNDLSASQYRSNDINGQPCALVKVQLAVSNVDFEGNVIKPIEYKGGEYWVYMTNGAQELRIKHQTDSPIFVPLHVRFEDYGIMSVQSLITYNLTLLMPQVVPVSTTDSRYLRLTVNPPNSIVTVDGKKQLVDENGFISVLLQPGSHHYQVEADGYTSQTGNVLISNKSVEKRIVLESSLVTVTVSCPTAGAQIYVDDKLMGGFPWKGQLAVGDHRIEARLTGYSSQTINETISQSSNKKITITALKLTTGSLDVDYKPKNAEVWIDGKRAGVSPNVFHDISTGTHTVELRAEGYNSKQVHINIEEDKTTILTGALEQLFSVTSTEASTPPFSITDTSTKTVSQIKSFTVKGVSFNMIRVDGGTFEIDPSSNLVGDVDNDGKPTQQVTLTPFYIGETEVTQALWKAVMGNNPSHYKGNQRPVNLHGLLPITACHSS